jgi:hypothetical protein
MNGVVLFVVVVIGWRPRAPESGAGKGRYNYRL